MLKIYVNFTKPLSIVSVLPFGAQFRRSGSLVDDRRIFSSTSGRNGRRRCVVSTRRSYGLHSTGLDGIVERTLPWPPHLSHRRSPLAGALSRFGFMRLLPMGLFQVYRSQRSTTDPSSPEDKYSERHRRNTGGHASEVVRNFTNRLNQCIDNGGRHLTDVIFKTT